MPAPRVVFVVAHDRSGIIGNGGKLPWHLPADLRFFRRITLGKPVVMGRKTFESIGKPLSGRRNIVLTRAANFAAGGVEIAHSVEEALSAAGGAAEVMVIGGAQVFRAFSPLLARAYVTEIDADVPGDVFYQRPGRSVLNRRVLEEHPADERNAFALKIVEEIYAEPNAALTGGSANESNPSA